MIQKRVVVLESERLLGAGVFSLLSTRANLDVREVWLNESGLAATLAAFKPEVVVVDEETLAHNLSVCSRLFQRFPSMRMVVLNPRANTLRICERQLVVVETIDDFLEML